MVLAAAVGGHPVATTPARAGFDDVLAAYERRDHAWAEYLLAMTYRDGDKVEPDVAEAFKWYRRAASSGLAEAQVDLGVMYYNGDGVAQDDAKALRWFRGAAEQGLAEGESNLGTLYDLGRGVPQDHGEAVRWYRRAAEQGLPDAQFNLGAMYEYGLGVTRDAARAHALYASAALGSPPGRARQQAERARDRTATQLSPAELTVARDLAARWRPPSGDATETASAQAVEPEAASESTGDGAAPDAFNASEGIGAFVQRPLSALGYEPGPIDGQLGPRTRAAIRAFEADNGMILTGQPSERLAIELLAALLDRWVEQRDAGRAGLGR